MSLKRTNPRKGLPWTLVCFKKYVRNMKEYEEIRGKYGKMCRKYEEVCKKYEEICGKYEDEHDHLLAKSPWRYGTHEIWKAMSPRRVTAVW